MCGYITIKIKEKKGVIDSKRKHFFMGKYIYIIPHLSTRYWLYIILHEKPRFLYKSKLLTGCYDIESSFYNLEGTHLMISFTSSFPVKREDDPFITKQLLKKVAFQWDLIKLELKGNPPSPFDPFHDFKSH